MANASIATALAISEAAQDGLHDDEVMDLARDLIHTLTNGDVRDEHIALLFRYSATLSANVATRVTTAIFTESEFDAMVDEMKEMGEFDNLE